jgi:hypothetical protein
VAAALPFVFQIEAGALLPAKIAHNATKTQSVRIGPWQAKRIAAAQDLHKQRTNPKPHQEPPDGHQSAEFSSRGTEKGQACSSAYSASGQALEDRRWGAKPERTRGKEGRRHY